MLKIRSLPNDTKIYCAHEYTLNNAKICPKFGPQNKKLKKIIDIKTKKRSMNIPTVPCNLGEEKVLNPFLISITKGTQKDWFRET